jgi:hypothetical protein
LNRELEAGTDTSIQQKLFLLKILSKSIINGVKLERKSRGEKKPNKSEEVYIGSNNEVRSKRIDLCVFLCCARAASATAAAVKTRRTRSTRSNERERERAGNACSESLAVI